MKYLIQLLLGLSIATPAFAHGTGPIHTHTPGAPLWTMGVSVFVLIALYYRCSRA